MTTQEQKSVFAVFRENSGKVSSTRIVVLSIVFVVLAMFIYATVIPNTKIADIPPSVATVLTAALGLLGYNKKQETKTPDV